jgi:hypothetical protein
MTASPPFQTRRGAITAGLITSVLFGAGAQARPTADDPSQGITGAPEDWAFLVGRWNVQHRRLKKRLVGDTQWEDFAGTCVNWPLMGGLGNVDDNVLELPGGTYRGVGVRAFDAETRQWSIWWIDSRRGGMDPPVRGGFKDGVGVFQGADTHEGRPIIARFRWSEITANTAKWDQAFSTDGGKTWETNWLMQFARAPA